jgi:acyl-CoA synthetase (AMP-forming)/AMP-acid ligase II
VHDGDIAAGHHRDEAGCIDIVDRTTDMCLCSGFNLDPPTIDEATYAHPAVADVCVIGIPGASSGMGEALALRPALPPGLLRSTCGRIVARLSADAI